MHKCDKMRMKSNGKWMSCFRSTCRFASHEKGLGSMWSRRYNGASEFPKTFNMNNKSWSGQEAAVEYKSRSHRESITVQEVRSKG